MGMTGWLRRLDDRSLGAAERRWPSLADEQVYLRRLRRAWPVLAIVGLALMLAPLVGGPDWLGMLAIPFTTFAAFALTQLKMRERAPK